MHRSGTSCLTGIMQQLGVELGEVYTENLHNRRGNRENSRIVMLNDALLNSNGGAWNRPTVVSHWNAEQAAERDAIVRTLRGRASPHWGFKDPRTLFTLPFWLQAIDKPLFIGTYRHPLRVALSLQSRDGSTLAAGWELWLQYNQRLLDLANAHRFPLTDFDQDDATYLDDVLGKLVGLGLDPARVTQARQFFAPELRNQRDSDIST
ncbi:MAG: sulfotransferase family protein, partial [Gammaproteobacteria bacterium]|nr:sulfotransferase family protein [Gammaproteobacteria bacterium]